MADSVRDPVELVIDDGFAWGKRVGGFVPKTIFYKEETANTAAEIVPAFFQDFGVPHPREFFTTIDENVSLEMTLADIDQHGEKWLLQNGYHLPHEPEPLKTEWVPIWPPLLRLVEVEPEWRSVDFEEHIQRREERRKKEEFDRAISAACDLCATGRDLALRERKYSWEYCHGVKFDRVTPCGAEKFHIERGTVTTLLVEEVA